jgi:hypothetical protein
MNSSASTFMKGGLPFKPETDLAGNIRQVWKKKMAFD